MNKGVIAAVGVAVVLAALVAFVAGGNEGAPDPETPYGVVTVEGALPPYGGQVDAAVGLSMPVAVGTTLDGAQYTLQPTGDPQAILFLAHWCSHCRAEVPAVQEWLDETGGVDGVGIVSVATSIDPGRPNYSPHDWLAREGWTPTTLWDDEPSSVLRSYGGTSFPFWVFVDGEGTVLQRVAGGIDVQDLERFLLTLAG